LRLLDKFLIISSLFFPSQATCEAISTKLSHGEKTHFTKYQSPQTNINNLGMNGLISLPSATALPDGELIFYQINHDKLSRTGFTFQLLPRIGVSFRYSGQGINGSMANGRVNYDRSFDIDFNVLNEKKNIPAISIGLRDFIGTGWYSSEYIVGTKNIGNFSISTGLGFGRLAGREQLTNPFSLISDKFNKRKNMNTGLGGALGNINWFTGPASPFFGFRYKYNSKTSLTFEYSPDLMIRESSYQEVKSPINVGLRHRLNDQISINTQYLHGNTFALGANIKLNPRRPLHGPGRDKAPIPLSKRDTLLKISTKNNIPIIKSLLEADRFFVSDIQIKKNHIRIEIENTKFRSIAQALGRISAILQRFSSNEIEYADIIILSKHFPIASYRLDLQAITNNQNIQYSLKSVQETIIPQAPPASPSHIKEGYKRFKSSLNPYLDYKLFDPQKPIRAEVGLEISSSYDISKNIQISGAVKKSLMTDLDQIIRYSNSKLPRVLSDFAIYDKEGQSGHLDNLMIKHRAKISKHIFSLMKVGYLEPMYAGISGELLHKNPKSNFAVGIDLNVVQMRDYDMQFGLRDYKTTSGHLNLYYDAGKSFDLEMNIGKYLAKDLGITTKISRRFGNGWSVGAYASLTDVPFDTFGEGSFDKGFYLMIPIDWIIGSPTKVKRRINIRPITRDGGAILGSSKTIYNFIKGSNQSELIREYGRFLK
jgi:hypothetical protein